MAGLGPALLALASCGSVSFGGSGASRDRAGEPEVRIWMAPLVHWEAGADRHVDLAIENGSTRTLALAGPDAAFARVEVFRGGDNLRLCGVDPRPAGAETRPRIEIPPGGSVAVRVDLSEACADVPPGDYRFEVDYRSPPARGAKAFSGAFATRYGELVVEPGPVATEAGRAPATRAGRAPPRSPASAAGMEPRRRLGYRDPPR